MNQNQNMDYAHDLELNTGGDPGPFARGIDSHVPRGYHAQRLQQSFIRKESSGHLKKPQQSRQVKKTSYLSQRNDNSVAAPMSNNLDNIAQHHNLIQMVGQQLPQGVRTYGSGGGSSGVHRSQERVSSQDMGDIINVHAAINFDNDGLNNRVSQIRKSPSDFSAFSANSSVTPKKPEGRGSSYNEQIMAISNTNNNQNNLKTPMVSQNQRRSRPAIDVQAQRLS